MNNISSVYSVHVLEKIVYKLFKPNTNGITWIVTQYFYIYYCAWMHHAILPDGLQ